MKQDVVPLKRGRREDDLVFAMRRIYFLRFMNELDP